MQARSKGINDNAPFDGLGCRMIPKRLNFTSACRNFALRIRDILLKENKKTSP